MRGLTTRRFKKVLASVMDDSRFFSSRKDGVYERQLATLYMLATVLEEIAKLRKKLDLLPSTQGQKPGRGDEVDSRDS